MLLLNDALVWLLAAKERLGAKLARTSGQSRATEAANKLSWRLESQ